MVRGFLRRFYILVLEIYFLKLRVFYNVSKFWKILVGD